MKTPMPSVTTVQRKFAQRLDLLRVRYLISKFEKEHGRHVFPLAKGMGLM